LKLQSIPIISNTISVTRFTRVWIETLCSFLPPPGDLGHPLHAGVD